MLPGIKKEGGAADEIVQVEWHEIACGDVHTVGVTPTGDLYAWGLGDSGQLGHGNEGTINKPKIVTCLAGKKVVHAACGNYHTAVVTSDGELYTWCVLKVQCYLKMSYYLQYQVTL